MNVSGCKICTAILLNLLGVGLLMVSQNASTIVKSLAAGKAVLTEGSQAAETFVNPPVNTHLKFYFFNLLNENETLNGGTPAVEEMGPYVYRIESKRFMTWEDNRTIYKTNKTYVFEPSLSKGTESDQITTLNPGSMLGTRFDASAVPFLFNTASVYEFLFEGVPAAEGQAFGYFQDQQGAIEGPIEAFTGEGNIDYLNRIIEYENEKQLTCESFRGTNGERFPPFSAPPSKLTLFNKKLCRPWDLHYDKNVEINGLDCVRYSNGRDLFSRTLNKTLDDCLESEASDEDKGIQGIFESGFCQPTGAPIMYSLPHFLNADTDILEHIKGLEPSEEKHNFYLDVYPALGFVLDMRVRVQVNFRLKKYGNEADKTLNDKIQEIIYPVFWQEMMLLKNNSEEAASIVYSNVEKPRILMFWIGVVVGALLILVGEILLLAGMCSNQSEEYAEDAYVTYSTRNNRSSVNMR